MSAVFMFDMEPMVILKANKMTYHEFISTYFDPKKFLLTHAKHEFTDSILTSANGIRSISLSELGSSYIKISDNATYYYEGKTKKFGSVVEMRDYFDTFAQYKNRVMRFMYGTDRIAVARINQVSPTSIEGYDLILSQNMSWDKKFIKLSSVEFLDTTY